MWPGYHTVLLIATMFLLPAGAGGAIAMIWRKLTQRKEIEAEAALDAPHGLPHEHHTLFVKSPAEAELEERQSEF